MTARPLLYADHNATTPLRPAARAAMLRALEEGGNPSSVHGPGRAARATLEAAREALAAALDARPDSVVFTSGATEGLHLAMESARAMGFGPVLVGAAEHDAVWAYAGVLFPDFETIPVDGDLVPDLGWLAERLGQLAGQRPLVILQAANNETGTVVPVGRAAALVRQQGGALICDAVQALGRIDPIGFAGATDWLVVSSHKIGGPPGAGAVIAAPGLIVGGPRAGGGQERGARPGTQNVPAIAGFAAAVTEACAPEAIRAWQALTGAERDAYEAMMLDGMPGARVMGAGALRLANTSCLAIPGWEAARQVMALDLEGAAISAGAACSSGKVKMSRALAAAGHPPDLAASAIRASFGWTTQAGDGARLASLHLAAARRARRLAA